MGIDILPLIVTLAAYSPISCDARTDACVDACTRALLFSVERSFRLRLSISSISLGVASLLSLFSREFPDIGKHLGEEFFEFLSRFAGVCPHPPHDTALARGIHIALQEADRGR